MRTTTIHRLAILAAFCLAGAIVRGDDDGDRGKPANGGSSGKDDRDGPKKAFPAHDALRKALQEVVAAENGGLGLNMWVTIVDRDGNVVAVAFSGENRGEQWPGSRVISAQKANTANAFSLPGLALSTANLYSAVQPGGSLFGLQESNPVNTEVAYRGNPRQHGRHNDPMVGGRIGGVNVFGGGLALYDATGKLVGGLGVSGDTSCTDHIIAWKLRHKLNLDNVPAGVHTVEEGVKSDDNIIHDIADSKSAGGFGHPVCDDAAKAIAESLSKDFPTGPDA